MKETTMRPLGMGWAAALALAAVMTMGGQARAEDEAAPAADEPVTPVPVGTSYTVETNATYLFVNHAYFGADKKHTTWGEGFTRMRVNHALPTGWWFSAGGVAMGTAGTDYYGTHDVGDGRLDQLTLGVSNLSGSGVSVLLGRQELEVGEGFVIGDGYRDTKAALWNIPLRFYDGVRADWQNGPWHALAFGANLSPSFGGEGFETEGVIAGGEVGWGEAEGDALSLGYFQRLDRGDTDLDARAVSFRGSYGVGPATLSGEVVVESGEVAGVTLAGRGGHLGLGVASEEKYEPFASIEYLRFSGDDPETADDESYYPFQYGWSDWSKWYVADLMASTLVSNSDTRVWKLECGLTPREGTSVRLLAHRIDLDTGASFGGLPEGVGRGFADEFDLVIDQSLGEHWAAWVLGTYATPRDAAKALVGSAKSGQVFASLTFKFGGPLGASD